MWQELLGDGVDVLGVPSSRFLFRPGQAPSLVLMQTGLLRVFTVTAAGRHVTLRYARRGDLIGLAPLIAGGDSWNAEAIRDSTISMVAMERLRSAAEGDRELSWRLTEYVAACAAEAVCMLADATELSMTVRVARHLQQMALRSLEGDAIASISHKRLADAVGTVREVISRELRKLRQRGVIATEVGRVTILNETLLASIATGERRVHSLEM
jgi:CRP/FNR family transcriptional regulator